MVEAICPASCLIIVSSPLWLKVLFVLELQYKHESICNGEVLAHDFWLC